MEVQSLGWEYPLEEEMATHSSVLAEEMLWTEEYGGLQSTGHKESDMTEMDSWMTKLQHKPTLEIFPCLVLKKFMWHEYKIVPLLFSCTQENGHQKLTG